MPPCQAGCNPEVETVSTLCEDCFYAFNVRSVSSGEMDNLFSNYIFINPMQGIGYSSHASFIETVCSLVPRSARVVEIGSSDGYLLSVLKSRGYERLSGIDPSPNVHEDFDVHIEKGFFTKDTVFNEEIDVFLMEAVFECFEKPWEILSAISARLSPNGLVLMRTVTYDNGFHHYHASLFTMPFIRRMAAASGLCVERPLKPGEGIVVFKKSDRSPIIDEIETHEEKKAVILGISEIAEREAKKRAGLNGFIRKGGEKSVYWYGTGLASAALFGVLDDDIKSDREFIVVDSDPRRKGLVFTPSGSEVRLASECLADRRLSRMVIATSLHSEVLDYLKELNCVVDSVYKY
jgi:hypothetical protein